MWQPFIFFLLFRAVISLDWYFSYGSRTINDLGHYSTYNESGTPKARWAANIWVTNDEKAFICCGVGPGDSYLNDVWRVDIQPFIWISGSKLNGYLGSYTYYDSVAKPAARSGGANWGQWNRTPSFATLAYLYHFIGPLKVGSNSYYYLMGGEKREATGSWGYISDLLRTSDFVSWTWIAGCYFIDNYGTYNDYNNVGYPAAKERPALWTYEEKVYLFGGWRRHSSGTPKGTMADLWVFDPTTNLFTWLAGCNQVIVLGVYPSEYGGIGFPSSRYYANNWRLNNSFYLLAGDTDLFFQRDDLWIASPTNLSSWIWLSGSDQNSKLGSYSEYNSPSWPSARRASGIWLLNETEIYLFGGRADAKDGFMDDFFVSKDGIEWIWLGGCYLADPLIAPYPSEYNMKGYPPSRESPLCWIISGKLCMFGGRNHTGSSGGFLNDYWEYTIKPPLPSSIEETFILSYINGGILLFGIIGILIFSVLRPMKLYRYNLGFEPFFILFSFLALLDGIANILFLILIFTEGFIFFIFLGFIVLTIIFNLIILIKWTKAVRTAQYEMVEWFRANIYYFIPIAIFSVLNMNTILIIKAGMQISIFSSPSIEQSKTTSIQDRAFFSSIYSLFPCSAVVLYYALLSSFASWSMMIWFIVLIKIWNLVIAINRIIFVLFIGGGKSNIKRQTALKYGVFRTIKDGKKEIPDLLSESSDNIQGSISSDSVPFYLKNVSSVSTISDDSRTDLHVRSTISSQSDDSKTDFNARSTISSDSV